MNPFYIRLFISALLISGLFMACGDDSSSSSSTAAAADSIAVETESPHTATLNILEGKWELIETHVDLDVFPMGGTFLNFTDQGNVIISNPNDPDLEDQSMIFLFDKKTIIYDNITQEILFLSADSMVLKRNTDGITQKDIYRKAANQ